VQQPPGQEVESHTHWPVVVLHSCPAGHAVHVAPFVPQEPFDSLLSASQDPEPVQHPAHDVPPQVHAPLTHESPLPHAVHAAPAFPHCVADCDP
jgi:hypothetical protein